MNLDLTPASLISRAIVLLVAVVVHEWAHVYAAYTQGDYTGYEQGRMTLDPRANVYWPGYLIGVLIGFAMLGSAPVNPYRMRNPRWGRLIAVAAGPLSNLVVAALFGTILRLTPLDLSNQTVGGLLPTPERLITDMVVFNALLFFFNLIPLAPLDGWTVMLTLLPREMAIWWERHQRESLYVFYGMIALTFLSAYVPVLARINPLNWLVMVPTVSLTYLLAGG